MLMVITSLQGCKSVNVVKETSTQDTIYRSETKVIRIAQKASSNIVVECDSLGNIKPFEFIVVSGESRATIKTDGNIISTTIEKPSDTISNIKEKEVHIKRIFEEKEVPFTPKWAWRLIFIGWGIIIGYVAYRFLRIYVPLLRFLPY